MSAGRWRCAVILLVLAVGLALALPATGQGRLRIQQALLGEPTKATLFIEIFGGEKTPVVDGDHLQFFCDGRPLPLLALTSLEESGEGTAYIFLVDVSKSLKEPQMALMRESLSRFVERMGPRDRGTLLTFGDDVRPLVDFTDDRSELLDQINGLRLSDMTTHLHRGLVRVQELGRRRDDGLPRRRLAIVLSDGKNEALGGETREEVLASLRRDGIPLFALGFYAPPLESVRPHLEWLRRFAEASGGEYFPPGGSVGEILEGLQRRLGQVWRADVDLSSLALDGREAVIEARLTRNGEILTDSTALRLSTTLSPSDLASSSGGQGASSPPLAEEPDGLRAVGTSSLFWILPLLGLLLLVAFALLFWRRRPRHGGTPPGAGTGPRELTIEVHRDGALLDVFSLSLTETLSLGRGEGNDVCLKGDLAISARHCELFLREGRLFVRDLASTNGTYLRDRRLEGAALVFVGDFLRIGQTTVRLRRFDGEESPS